MRKWHIAYRKGKEDRKFYSNALTELTRNRIPFFIVQMLSHITQNIRKIQDIVELNFKPTSFQSFQLSIINQADGKKG